MAPHAPLLAPGAAATLPRPAPAGKRIPPRPGRAGPAPAPIVCRTDYGPLPRAAFRRFDRRNFARTALPGTRGIRRPARGALRSRLGALGARRRSGNRACEKSIGAISESSGFAVHGGFETGARGGGFGGSDEVEPPPGRCRGTRSQRRESRAASPSTACRIEKRRSSRNTHPAMIVSRSVSKQAMAFPSRIGAARPGSLSRRSGSRFSKAA